MAHFPRRVVAAVIVTLLLLALAPRSASTTPTPSAVRANLYVKDLQLAQSHVTPGSRVAAKVTIPKVVLSEVPSPIVPSAPTPAPAPVPRADLVTSSLKLGTATVATGGTTPVQVTVANRGTATAGAVQVMISLVSGATTSRVASLNVGKLVAGASGTVVTTLTAPMLAGTYTVLATATTPDPETSTANNAVTTTLGVSSALAPLLQRRPTATTTHRPLARVTARRRRHHSESLTSWTVARPGKTLCLLDGTYRGADSMIVPAHGLSGTKGNPITVKAMQRWRRHDRRYSSRESRLTSPAGTTGGSSRASTPRTARRVVVNVRGNDNIVRRVVAWDMSCLRAQVPSSPASQPAHGTCLRTWLASESGHTS